MQILSSNHKERHSKLENEASVPNFSLSHQDKLRSFLLFALLANGAAKPPLSLGETSRQAETSGAPMKEALA